MLPNAISLFGTPVAADFGEMVNAGPVSIHGAKADVEGPRMNQSLPNSRREGRRVVAPMSAPEEIVTYCGEERLIHPSFLILAVFIAYRQRSHSVEQVLIARSDGYPADHDGTKRTMAKIRKYQKFT
ncbi:hypothetical protein HPP92_006354 [Vanilla planifolia]|uniref:Uncharacterized protein n=1 Tax=Vanilla planifolia TaxID=51239 RepID=A0A835VAV2_VANPL|nr:hypothetical protein HPP92_006354 [Vanilla planifolia]